MFKKLSRCFSPCIAPPSEAKAGTSLPNELPNLQAPEPIGGTPSTSRDANTPEDPVATHRKAAQDRARVLGTNLTDEASSSTKGKHKADQDSSPPPVSSTAEMQKQPRASRKRDKYNNFQELAAAKQEGRDYSITYRNNASHVAIIAPHGGGIEPGTSEIARAIAGEDLSHYAFEGLMSAKNSELHITSNKFDEPRCLDLLRSSATAITIHGAAGTDKTVYIGGLDSEAKRRLTASLTKHGFNVGTHPDSWMQGADNSNICNRGHSGVGVQLELSRGLRESFFNSLYDRDKTTPRLAQFAEAVREGALL